MSGFASILIIDHFTTPEEINVNNNLNVRIIELPPMRVASALGFGPEPEMLAWNKLTQWAAARGLNPTEARLFGFNNPNPTAGSPNYGYEVWMMVGPEVVSDDVVTVKDAPGGLYAVTHCRGVAAIFPTWQALVAWTEQSSYRATADQCLEEHINVGPDVPPEALELDLYLPVKA